MSSVIWVSYRTTKDQKPKINTLILNKTQVTSSKAIKESLLKLFELNNKLNVKLRNKNGNLVPINQNLPINRKQTSYELEIFLPNIREPSKYHESALKEVCRIFISLYYFYIFKF
jgi:hypothetical protein